MTNGDPPWYYFNEPFNEPLAYDIAPLPQSSPTLQDAGYFFAPYIPLIQTPVMLDPNSPRRPILTRYSRQQLREGARYYGTITFDQNGYMQTVNEEKEQKVNWLKEGF